MLYPALNAPELPVARRVILLSHAVIRLSHRVIRVSHRVIRVSHGVIRLTHGVIRASRFVRPLRAGFAGRARRVTFADVLQDISSSSYSLASALRFLNFAAR